MRTDTLKIPNLAEELALLSEPLGSDKRVVEVRQRLGALADKAPALIEERAKAETATRTAEGRVLDTGSVRSAVATITKAQAATDQLTGELAAYDRLAIDLDEEILRVLGVVADERAKRVGEALKSARVLLEAANHALRRAEHQYAVLNASASQLGARVAAMAGSVRIQRLVGTDADGVPIWGSEQGYAPRVAAELVAKGEGRYCQCWRQMLADSAQGREPQPEAQESTDRAKPICPAGAVIGPAVQYSGKDWTPKLERSTGGGQ